MLYWAAKSFGSHQAMSNELLCISRGHEDAFNRSAGSPILSGQNLQKRNKREGEQGLKLAAWKHLQIPLARHISEL